jgi:purine-nucleoside phosphorylase
MAAAPQCDLDASVFAALGALEARGVPAPSALLLSMTGLGLLPGRLSEAGRLPLEVLPEVPASWTQALLHWGHLEGLPVWLLEDHGSQAGAAGRAWERAWPVWLASAAGAATLVHCSAASALGEIQVGTIALARDHINLSGTTPLTGLAASRLGPLFPDTSLLHDRHLRADALAACRQLGLAGLEAVFAATSGPSLETPAEQRWLRSAGADVSVQDLAGPLLAAAHAGMGALALGVVVVHAGERVDIASVAASAQRLAPALDDLLLAVAAAAEKRARESLEEPRP